MISWEYMAGFFDGEGSISRATKSSYKVSFSQNYKPVLDEIKIFLDSHNIHSWFSKYKNKVGNDGYHLTFSESWAVRWFLEGLLPYLIVKKDKALEALNIIPVDAKPINRLSKVRSAIRIMRKGGLTYDEIIDMTGISRGTIERAVKEV